MKGVGFSKDFTANREDLAESNGIISTGMAFVFVNTGFSCEA